MKIVNSMSNGRKIFRFLKFIEGLGALQNVFSKRKPMILKVLWSTYHLLRVIYYSLDNVIWAASIGVLTELVSPASLLRLRDWRNMVLLIRTITKIAVCSIAMYNYEKTTKEYQKQLLGLPNHLMVENDRSCEIIRGYLKKRRKIRFAKLRIFHSCLHILILIKNLRFPW